MRLFAAARGAFRHVLFVDGLVWSASGVAVYGCVRIRSMVQLMIYIYDYILCLAARGVRLPPNCSHTAAVPATSVCVCVCVCVCMCMCVVLYCVVSSAALPPSSVSCVVCLSLRCRSLAFRALAQSHDLLGVLRTK